MLILSWILVILCTITQSIEWHKKLNICFYTVGFGVGGKYVLGIGLGVVLGSGKSNLISGFG